MTETSTLCVVLGTFCMLTGPACSRGETWVTQPPVDRGVAYSAADARLLAYDPMTAEPWPVPQPGARALGPEPLATEQLAVADAMVLHLIDSWVALDPELSDVCIRLFNAPAPAALLDRFRGSGTPVRVHPDCSPPGSIAFGIDEIALPGKDHAVVRAGTVGYGNDFWLQRIRGRWLVVGEGLATVS